MKSYSSRQRHSYNQPVIIGIVVFVLVAGGIGYYAFQRHQRKNAAPKGGWTFLGTATNSATELGGNSKMSTYACIDKVSSTSWTLKAKAVLSPIPANTSSYAFTLLDWPYQSLVDAPGGGSESPRKQVKSNSWSGGSTTAQITIDPSKSNYVEVNASNKGFGGKLLPTPISRLPNASQLTNC
jgi:hypothetical protein